MRVGEWTARRRAWRQLGRLAEGIAAGPSPGVAGKDGLRAAEIAATLSRALAQLQDQVRGDAERARRLEDEREAARREVDAVRAELANTALRLELTRASNHAGLWDMSVAPGGDIGMDHPFWWSAQFRRLLGFEDERDFPNVLGSWAERLHPDDRERTLAAFAHHLRDRTGATPYDITYRLATRSGEYRWFRATGATHRDDAGNPLRVAGSLTDITEDKLREARLEVALSRFELSAEMLADGIWDMDVVAGDPLNPANAFW